jgi:hypothetical protein
MPIKVEAGKAVGKSVKGMFNEPKQLYEDFARMGGGDTGLIYPKSHLDRYMDRLPPGLEPEVKEAIMRGAKKKLMLRYGEEAIHPRAIETNTIHMSDATAHIAHKWNEYANPHDSALLTKIIEKRDLTVQEISQILGGKEMGIQDPSLRRLISDSIGEDLRLYDKAKGTYFKVSRDAATEAYRELANELVKNPLFINILKRYDPAYSLKVGGKRLISPSPQESSKPAYIIRDMFDTGNPEELQALKDALPKDVWNGAFANFIEDLMLKSKSYNPENKTFNPWPWQEAWTRVKPTISKVEPEVAKRIDKFTDMTVAIRDQISKEVPTFADSLSKSFATGFTGLGSMLGASFGGNKSALWAIPVMEGFGSFMAWGFLGPSGKGSFGRLVGMGTKAAIGESPMSKSLSNALDEKIKQYSGD